MKKLPSQNHFQFKPREVIISTKNGSKDQLLKYDSVISSILNQASPSNILLVQSKSYKEPIIQLKSREKSREKLKTESKHDNYMLHSHSIKSDLQSRFLSPKHSKNNLLYCNNSTMSPIPSCLSHKLKQCIPSTQIKKINLEQCSYNKKKIKVISFVRCNNNNNDRNKNKLINPKEFYNKLNETKSFSGMNQDSPKLREIQIVQQKDKASFQGTININFNVFVQSPNKNKLKDNDHSCDVSEVKKFKIRNHSNLSKEREKRNFENKLTFAEREKSLEELGQKITSIHLTQHEESTNSILHDACTTDLIKPRARIINIFRMKKKNEYERINTLN